MKSIPIEVALPGDIVFLRGSDFVGRAIRWAERIRFKGGAQWNHVAILKEQRGEDWTLYQAGGRGITSTGLLPRWPDTRGGYVVRALPVGTDRKRVLEFAEAQVGTKYGFLTIVSILFTLFSPKFVDVMLPNTWICSAYGAEAMRAGGWIHNFPDVYQVSPASLWESYPE